MPLYLYRCPDCGIEFEETKPVGQGEIAICPKCGTIADKIPAKFSFIMR